MIIKKSRINSVDKYFANIAEDKEVYVSVPRNILSVQTIDLFFPLQSLLTLYSPPIQYPLLTVRMVSLLN